MAPAEPSGASASRRPLLEMSRSQTGAIVLNEAMQFRSLDTCPTETKAWELYTKVHHTGFWCNAGIGALLLLTVFERPLWLNQYDDARNHLAAAAESDKSRALAESMAVWDEQMNLLSGIPFLPIPLGLLIEVGLLGLLLWRVRALDALCSLRDPVRKRAMLFNYAMVFLGLADAAGYALFFASTRSASTFRLAPFVRFGLAASMIPTIGKLVKSFARSLVAISTVGLFLLGTVVLFAWTAAMILDDLDIENADGMPVNQGFESFGNAVYTSFVTMTTANLPDAMVPSYLYNRGFVFLWLPFFALAVCIFMQVILATVYGDYQDQKTEEMKDAMVHRRRGINQAFDQVKADGKRKLQRRRKQRQQPPGGGNDTSTEVVRYEDFDDLVKTVQTLGGAAGTADRESIIKVIFNALDDDGNGVLDRAEFNEMCDVLQYKFTITKRDGWARSYPRGEESGLGRMLKRLLEAEKGEGGDGDADVGGVGCGYLDRFPGSQFESIMNLVLSANVVWIVIQSVYDLNDFDEPAWFQGVDLVFCVSYVLEVLLKLSWWSWSEYWTSNDNRFDFVTTVILSLAACAVLLGDVHGDFLQYVNMLRLVRLLKALNNIPVYQETCSVIGRMLSTCSDVLLMNVLVIYLWSALGVQLFGGKLSKLNPKIRDSDYFDSNFEVYSFNDVPSAMVTLVFFMLTDWVDPVAGVCMQLADRFTPFWLVSTGFMLSFYVVSPLLAFNVFTAFSIDVFCKLEEFVEKKEERSEVERNLDRIKEDLGKRGMCLHIEETAELSRTRVYRSMFVEDAEEEEGS